MTNKFIFYGAGEYARSNLGLWIGAGLIPHCFADQDASKWNKPFQNDCGVDCMVLSLEEALRKYPGSQVLICVSRHNEADVMQCLEKYDGTMKFLTFSKWKRQRNAAQCKLLKHHLHIQDQKIRPCCGKWSTPQNCSFAIAPSGNLNADLEKYFQRRDEEFASLGLLESTTCGRCLMPFPGDAFDNGNTEIKSVELSTSKIGFAKCNYHCIYCSVHNEDSGLLDDCASDMRILSIFSEICRFPKLEYLYFNYGELSCYGTCDDICRLWLEKGLGGMIFTNSYIFKQSISDTLLAGKTKLLISIDAGTGETYRKIKGIDSFDRVRENIKKYSSACPGCIILKYIILDDLNTNAADIHGFIRLAESMNASVALAVDFRNPPRQWSEITSGAYKMLTQLIESRNLSLFESNRIRIAKLANGIPCGGGGGGILN